MIPPAWSPAGAANPRVRRPRSGTSPGSCGPAAAGPCGARCTGASAASSWSPPSPPQTQAGLRGFTAPWQSPRSGW